MSTSGMDPRLAHLAELFSNLPGLGPRSAARLVTELLTTRIDVAREIVSELKEAIPRVGHCRSCNTLCTEEVCPICARPERDKTIICVVESPSDMIAIEESVAYSGSYFVLMGRVNPLKGIGPEELGIGQLLRRVLTEGVREVVLATSYTAEGETTAHMIAALLKKEAPTVRVTRLSKGISAGVEVEYTDPASLSAAILGRH